ncbi:hypothetical protein LAZ67_2005217, partial [Cordylochernes scorpioides]
MASLPSHDVTLNKLDGYNYSLWSFKIEMLLQKEDLWEVVTENIPDEPKIEWKKKDSKARAIINLSIADSQIVHVKNLLTAKATWDTLKNIYERKTLSGKIYLLRKLYSLKLEEDKDMQQHITTMMELVDKLRTIGETLKDSHITAILLCSLPKSYSNLITMLESRPDDELTLEFTKNKLLDEHTRRVESSKDESTASKALKSLHGASSQRREKEKKSCSFCHKPNHSKEECWHYQKRNNSNKEYKYENFRRGNVPKYTNQSSVTQEQPTNQRTTKGPNPKALNCTQREASVHNWFVDSGATSHMAYDESFFTELNREQTQNVVVANGNKLQVKGIGQGEIKVITPQGKTDTLLLTKVLYIPELTDNLLSVSAATSNGCKVTFNRDWCTIERDNTALANGILDNGKYRLHLDDNPQTRTFKANVAKQNHCKNKNCLMLWHDRLGHRNIESIKKIRNENLARGLSLNNCSHSTDCVQCIQGKLTETPFPKKTEYRATETLQLVHSDICGPLPTNSLSGKRYFITFTDDYSRYTKIYLLKGKDEAYEKIKDYVISAHTEFGKNIQTIRTDNGREYVNRQVEDFLNQSGIKHQLTVPYSPAQNGVAERKNRSLMEMTRCMLFDSGLPQSLWAEAVTTANYLHNRIPSKATDKTPFELWTNRKPSLKHIKRFGCKAFAYIPKIKRNKLDSKVIEGIFLGYDDRSKGYRILHDTDNITISRSVKFIEKENGFHLASTKTTSPQVLSTDLTSSNHIGNAEESQEPGTQSENLEDSETEDYIQPGTSTGTQVVTQRRSTRPTKGIPPIRNDYMLYKTEAQDIQTPTSYSEVLQLPKIEREKWLQAMNEELNSLEKNNVWELTLLPKDKKIIGCKWTYKQKLNSKGEIERYKARLVAKGFNQKFGRDYEETFAPIVKHSTIRAFLAASVYKGMKVNHLDVKTAFLHGDLDKELYMELPEGLHTKQTNKVCKLKKAIYGLKQAGRSWNTKIASTLIKNNFKQSIVDPCLFTKNEENHSIYLILYVDDMLLASDSEIIIQNTVKTLEKEFEIKNLGDPTQFIGIEISRNREGELLLRQKNKIQELVERYNLQEAKPTFTPMESGYPAEASQELLWLLDLLRDLELEQKAPIYFHQDNQSCLKICSSEKVCIEISRNREGELLLRQKNKIQELVERYNLQEAKPTFTPMESGYPGISDEKLLPNNVQYQQLIGSLLYLSVVSRPDIAAPVCILSSRNQNPRNCDWNAAKRIVRYLKTTKELELRISNQKPPTLEAYSDATWASDNTDRKSLSGNLFLLGSNPISWMTGKQGCVSFSSTEAELISAAEASQELLWLLDLLRDLELEQKAPIYFHQDNQSCLKICSSEKVSSRTKHIATKIHHLKDLQKKTVIEMIYCPTGDMKADILTKPLPRPTFEKLRYNLVMPGEESFDIFVQRFEAAFEANALEEGKRMPIFVSLLDSEMLKLGNDLFFPSTMKEQPYERLIQRIKLHLAPRKKVIPQRCRFLKRIQLENESVSEYLRELRHLAMDCTFGEMLEVMLRDRFVAGIKSESLQKKLLQEDDDVTLDRVFSIAVSFVLAEQNAKELQDGLVAKLDIVPGGSRKNEARRGWQHGPGMQRRETICFRCGEKNSHLAPACPHKTKPCFKCKRIGHLSRVCKTSKSLPDCRYVQDEFIYSVQGDTDAKINLHVDEYQLCFVVDTGSPVTLIPKTIYEKYWKDNKLSPSYLRLRSFCGKPIKIIGERRVFVKEANQDLRLIVVDEDISIVLLGREWLKGLNLDFSRLLNIRQARSLPFSLKKKVENEIDGMVNEGILQPIEYANWAAPIVPVLKKDGSLRICGDFRCTANKAIELDKYPLPSIDEIFSKLSGNTVFSSLDLSRAYLQVRLSEEAKRVVNINTTKELFAFKRLPYGVAVAPNKFQREMDNLFADMSGVVCYIDDILVAGKDHRDHEQKLELVFKRLQEKGLRLNKDKCKFAVYKKYCRHFSALLSPLKKNSKWNWTGEHRILFAKCKALLTNESVLAHYDATRELVLACDASSYGLGVVLSHRNDRKEETPIAFASRTLTEAERRYSQLEKEALSIIFGCEKFRQYLLGREFVLITDNRPLMNIFSPQKPIPICAASRIKRWSLKLSAFKYTVEFRKTDDNGNADALSRLPLVSKTTESLDEDQVLLLRKMSEVPFSFQDVAVETRRDKLLSIVLRNVRENNWQIPKVSQENPLCSYYRIKDELSCEFGCLQWRERVVIPQKLRSLILNDLHEMHLGMVKMKMIARRYFWWPGIDKNIEELARDCRVCQESASMPPSTISEWTWPEKPWHRLHLDLAGPFMGRMFMVLVDAYTKWLEIVIIKDITSRTIIGHLREIFARFGLPELLVTDNGRQFVSSEFEEFTKINGIRHTKTSPYNPSTNGLAERYVREFKNSLRKNQGKDSIEINLQRFLFTHRAFPQTVSKESPAELLMKRNLRSRFSNLIPKMAKVGEVYHDAMRKQEHFAVGSDVYFRSFANGPKWKRGRVMELLSSRHYLIEDEGRYVKRHINQLRPVIKKEVPEVRDLVLPGTSRDFILPGTSRDHPRLGGQEKTREEAPEVDEELKGAESSAQEDTPEPEPGPAAAAVPVP